jgi:hypothetical protein
MGISFSNAFSNAGDYVRSRLNTGELKAQHFNRLRPPTNVSELKTTAWHSRGQEFESPYLHDVVETSTFSLLRVVCDTSAWPDLSNRQFWFQNMYETIA